MLLFYVRVSVVQLYSASASCLIVLNYLYATIRGFTSHAVQFHVCDEYCALRFKAMRHHHNHTRTPATAKKKTCFLCCFARNVFFSSTYYMFLTCVFG